MSYNGADKRRFFRARNRAKKKMCRARRRIQSFPNLRAASADRGRRERKRSRPQRLSAVIRSWRGFYLIILLTIKIGILL